jgi:hypothetical protein
MNKIFCSKCNKEIPFGSMAINYSDKYFDSYRCVSLFEGLDLDKSLPSMMKKSSLKTIMKE